MNLTPEQRERIRLLLEQELRRAAQEQGATAAEIAERRAARPDRDEEDRVTGP